MCPAIHGRPVQDGWSDPSTYLRPKNITQKKIQTLDVSLVQMSDHVTMLCLQHLLDDASGAVTYMGVCN